MGGLTHLHALKTKNFHQSSISSYTPKRRISRARLLERGDLGENQGKGEDIYILQRGIASPLKKAFSYKRFGSHSSGFHTLQLNGPLGLPFASHQFQTQFRTYPWRKQSSISTSTYGNSFFSMTDNDEYDNDARYSDSYLLEAPIDNEQTNTSVITIEDEELLKPNNDDDSTDIMINELLKQVKAIKIELQKKRESSLFRARLEQHEEEMRLSEQPKVSKDWIAYEEQRDAKVDQLLLLPSHEVVMSHDSPITFSVTGGDLQTLNGLKWLNDVIINTYFALMYERSQNNPSLPKVWIFNSFFFERLKQKGYDGVKRWAKKAKPSVFAFDIILIPINVNGNHWCCGCLSLKEKSISYYDSMGGGGGTFFKTIRSWLIGEGEKRGHNIDLNEWKDLKTDCPQQENTSDCGVFASQIGNSLALGEDGFWFSQGEMPRIRKEMMIEIAYGKLHSSLQMQSLSNEYSDYPYNHYN